MEKSYWIVRNSTKKEIKIVSKDSAEWCDKFEVDDLADSSAITANKTNE